MVIRKMLGFQQSLFAVSISISIHFKLQLPKSFELENFIHCILMNVVINVIDIDAIVFAVFVVVKVIGIDAIVIC